MMKQPRSQLSTKQGNVALLALWRSLRASIPMIVALPLLSTNRVAAYSSMTMAMAMKIDMPPEVIAHHRNLAEDSGPNHTIAPSFAPSVGWKDNNETLRDDDDDDDVENQPLCEDLVDSATFRFDANPFKDCGSWVAERPVRRCRKTDPIRNQLVRSACPWTCEKACRSRIHNETESTAPSASPSVRSDPMDTSPTTTTTTTTTTSTTTTTENILGATESPSRSPSGSPSQGPSRAPSQAPTRVPTVGVVDSREMQDWKRRGKAKKGRAFATGRSILIGVVVVAVVLGGVAAGIAFGTQHGRTKKRGKKKGGNEEHQQEQQQRIPSTDASGASSVDSCSCYLENDYGIDNDYDYEYGDDCWSISVVSIPPLPPNGDYERRDDRREGDIEKGAEDSVPVFPEAQEDPTPAMEVSLSDRMSSF